MSENNIENVDNSQRVSFKNGFPRFDKSVKNYLFEPIPWLAPDDYRNRNRRVWTQEEIDELKMNAFGTKGVTPASIYLCVEELDLPSETKRAPIKGTNKTTFDVWCVGRIVDIGAKSFDTTEFPPEAGGATATIGDIVIFNPMGIRRHKYRKGNLLVMKDVNIMLTIEDIEDCVNG